MAEERERSNSPYEPESEADRARRLAAGRRRQVEVRNLESREEREARLARDRERRALNRANETPEAREARLAANRARYAQRRANVGGQMQDDGDHPVGIDVPPLPQARHSRGRQDETAEAREARLAANRARYAQRRAIAQAQPIPREEQQVEVLPVWEVDRRGVASLLNVAFQYRPDYNYADHPALQIGELSNTCRHCSALSYGGEANGICCKAGKVRLPYIPQPPEPILSLFSGDYPDSRSFLSNIRRYNSCFQMTSFGVTGNSNHGQGMTFKIQGQIYHRMGSLLPIQGEQPKFAQIYFMGDSNIQIDLRCGLFEGVRRNIVANFQELFDQHNQCVQLFRTALEQMPSDNYGIMIRADRTPEGEHHGRFNAPVQDEVAIILIEGERPSRDIIIHRRDRGLQRISETHRLYDALQYPLLFWQGMETYHFGLRQVDPVSGAPTNKKVSSMSYYSYHLMVREESQSFILRCGALLSQFVVDMYAKVESERLLFIRLNQNQLRVDEYIHLRDEIRNEGDADNIGRRFILPSSFTGSPRHMQEYAQDAIAYVRIFGRPALFITFTCNPLWRELTVHLKDHQQAHDRQDLTSRVFRQKLLKLMGVIKTHKLFGPVICYMYSIEWQKRGLPHAHILIWLENRIRPEQIDCIISAELPDPEIDPLLSNIIRRHMVHGPCGLARPRSVCMQDGRCVKRFPRSFIAETQSGEDGYPLYKRRSPQDGGQSFIQESREGSFEIDNRWIVPYCSTLSRMFAAHINVEYCHSVKAIKYICKYINKGSDMAVVAIEQHRDDEIMQYQLGRYISSSEACWRLFSFPIHDRFPAVEHLHVHLENGQRVYFNPNNAAVIAENPPNTTLTSFFSLCCVDPFARTLLYSEIPTYYTWNKSRKVWQRRRRGNEIGGRSATIGRVYTVSPRQSECYFLRMLLMKVRGPSSFTYLKQYAGIEYQTYREACLARGLLEDDNHWELTLREAASSRTPVYLRELFAIILSVCETSNPSNLWNVFREDLSEDILHRQRRANPDLDLNFNDSIFNQSLIIIEDFCLRMCGKNLTELGLQIRPDRDILDAGNAEILRETSYDRPDLDRILAENEPLLTPDQRTAFRFIINSIDNQEGGIFFIDAPGGTGKTFLLNLILAHVRSRGEIILALASSGIAATLLAGGRTAHTGLKLPLDIHRCAAPTLNITRNSAKGQLLRQCRAIIWDECTMAHKKSLEALNSSLKDIRDSSEIFGGVVVVLAGDFRQTLPVMARSTPADELNACLKQSTLWRFVIKYRLQTNMRVHLRREEGAAAFADILLRIGNGVFPTIPNSPYIRLTAELCHTVSTRDQLINEVFPNIQQNLRDHRWLCERAILAPTNETVDEINSCILEKLINQEQRIYLSVDTLLDTEQAVTFPIEFLNSLTPYGLPPHELKLKVGSSIILLRNLNPPKLCNGSRLVIKRLQNNVIQATILVGAHRGEDVFIPRIPMAPTDTIYEFKRLQFPVRTAFAMTINKSQGQSLHVVGIDLSEPCFSHGQLYVACSRVGSANNMFILAPNNETRNVVYPQALL